ncbi:right-handed parallel beta-helix repeat-containing protein [Rudanella paleaurantiibacter]|uniref:Right-handed parallel beta-helix repeat-containing protein n=1 Tax=Rudanella paleaurantiibacter TaxID=2614655 RepID=A0A7J5U7I5_9BACT|nr:right-handed parallel beta-helix repeat-containing protein [Rudanella paleaurantiibacter]KAB7733120.1 right-handed parallel beta-helix repeat-containing protein [Rudanella paleaurantiibacter]
MRWFLAFWIMATVAFAQTPMIGDAGWQFDESRFDPRFPAMREWAKAGVQGGIPARSATPVRATLRPGDNLQQAIDQIATNGGGAILLRKGDYLIRQTVTIRSGVILRGEHRDSTRLLVQIKAPFFKTNGSTPATAVAVTDAERVGVENLTMRYAAVPFEPNDRADTNAAWSPDVFHRPELRDTTVYVHLLIFTRCRNSWVDGCTFLWAGAHPLGVSACQHMTLRHNLIDRAYIKQDSRHGGYYGCWGSSYCLFYNETVRRIRHFALMLPGCRYNVVLNCNFEVDVNFHDRDDGDNLVEGCRMHTPVWHSWAAVATGTPAKHGPPGKGNLLFNNSVRSKGKAGFSTKAPLLAEPSVIYEVTNQFGSPIVSALRDAGPPKGGTLYAVRAEP